MEESNFWQLILRHPEADDVSVHVVRVLDIVSSAGSQFIACR